MADDMYDESGPSEAGGGINEEPKEPKSEETEDQMALVPKQFFKDEPKPGNREMVEIVEVYEGEVSIKCVYGDDEKEEKPEAIDDDSAPTQAEDPMMS